MVKTCIESPTVVSEHTKLECRKRGGGNELDDRIPKIQVGASPLKISAEVTRRSIQPRLFFSTSNIHELTVGRKFIGFRRA